MNRKTAILCFFTAMALAILRFPSGAVAVLLIIAMSIPVIVWLRKNTEDGDFLIQLFLGALLVRILFGGFIDTFELLSFFGGDALTYDTLGQQINAVWFGKASPDDWLSQRAMSTGTPGWGMNYLVALIYLVTGPNPLAAQSFCAVIGAATSPLVYICSMKIFHNRRVGKLAALLVAFLPAFIIWSGQLLKDGLIIFLLVLAMTMVIRLQKNFSYVAVAVLIFSLFGILSLRFYIFYMVAVSVAGSFIIGQSGSARSMARGLILLVIMGIALTYLGVLRTATENFEKFGNMDQLQSSRSDMAKRGDSGFGEDLDVSSAEGAVVALPIGLLFLMLAPFPWQATSLRQAITMPEMFVWWAMIPLIFTGLAYTIRHKLREAIPILIFTLMLTIAYSIFQGNVGTAYRQRTQIQVFLFMFIAVGWTLMQEKRENQRAARLAARQKQEAGFIKRGVEG
ncbi:MAG: phospholipid carrier-dependent glycosyltransferase [Acidobacteria bacterium]|nr:phospholipid carrier-dependent glycosyltransferase [Acidobacteriota bacterium]